MTGRRPIPTRWVDILKVEDERSRWAAKDFKGNDKNRDDLFASMPPLEAKKALFRVGSIKMKPRNGEKKMKMLFIDVKKAHLNAKCNQEDILCRAPIRSESRTRDVWEAKEMALRNAWSSAGVGNRVHRETRIDRVQAVKIQPSSLLQTIRWNLFGCTRG